MIESIPGASELVAEGRLTMIRVLLITLGTRDDLAYAMELPGIFPDP